METSGPSFQSLTPSSNGNASSGKHHKKSLAEGKGGHKKKSNSSESNDTSESSESSSESTSSSSDDYYSKKSKRKYRKKRKKKKEIKKKKRKTEGNNEMLQQFMQNISTTISNKFSHYDKLFAKIVPNAPPIGQQEPIVPDDLLSNNNNDMNTLHHIIDGSEVSAHQHDGIISGMQVITWTDQNQNDTQMQNFQHHYQVNGESKALIIQDHFDSNMPQVRPFPENVEEWLGQETNKVKQTDLRHGITFRYFVRCSAFDFVTAANMHIPGLSARNSKVVTPANNFTDWASRAVEFKYNLAQLEDGARIMASQFVWILTGGGNRAPYFNTTNMHHFCGAAANAFKELNTRYDYLQQAWARMQRGKSIPEEDHLAMCDIDVVDTSFSLRIYWKMYKCLDDLKDKWDKTHPCPENMINPLPPKEAKGKARRIKRPK